MLRSTDQGTGPAGRVRRLVTALVILDLALLMVAGGAWMLARTEQSRENALNGGLRGSLPPSGQSMQDLSGIAGVEPPVPPPARLRGHAVALVATCLDCRSGQVLGGYLGRLDREDVPPGARMLLIGWDGDAAAWSERWGVDPAVVEMHVARTEAAAYALRDRFGVGRRSGAEESGITFLHDPEGRWRSTFFIGQVNRDDIRHDLDALADEAGQPPQ